MKKTIKISVMRLFISVMLLSVSFSGLAQFTETREFVRRFSIHPETRIDITNKYGRIELNTWEKDSVVIRFKMEINEKKPIKPEKSLNNLDFDISNSEHYLVVRTQLDKNRSQIENEFQKFKETMLQTGSSMRIDLTVFLPNNHELRLENKFGDIILGNYKGETQIVLSNGKLQAGDLPKKSGMNLSFADALINDLPNGRIVCNYSDVEIKKAGIVRFESKSSTIEVSESDDLSIDSRRDKFRIRQANKLDAMANFSQFRISELKDKANFRMNYGNLEMEKIMNTFTSIFIESRSTDVNLYFHPESKFNFEITEAKTDLKLGHEMKVEDKDVIDSKESKTRHSGYFGKKMKDEQLIINSVGGEMNIISY